MNLKQFHNVYSNANMPSAARIGAAFALFGFALGELLVGLGYIALCALAVFVIGAALFYDFDVIGWLPERARGMLLGCLILAVFADRLQRWSLVAAARAAAAIPREPKR